MIKDIVEELEFEKWEDDGEGLLEKDVTWNLLYETDTEIGIHQLTGQGFAPEHMPDLISLLEYMKEDIESQINDPIDHLTLYLDDLFDPKALYESLDVDREKNTMTYIRALQDGATVKQEYYVPNIIPEILDDAMKQLTGLDDYHGIKEDPEACRIKVSITRSTSMEETYTFSYNRRGFKTTWCYLIAHIYSYIESVGITGYLFNHNYFGHGVRPGENIYCSVAYEEDGKTYYYLTDDDSLVEGDFVDVPVGVSNTIMVGKIIAIDYYPTGKVPYPLDQIKSIVGRHEIEDEDSIKAA